MKSTWTKASRSNNQGNCVEVRWLDGKVQVRDSKDPNGPVLTFTATEWEAFVGRVTEGEFNV